jgi:hypothetical protein
MIKRFLPLLLVFFLVPVAAHAATLTLGGPGSVRVGDVFTVPVLLSTAASANAVSGTVTYPTDLLTLQSVSKSGSIITLWPTDPSTGNATVDFGGIILNPGWSGTRGTIVTMTFVAKSVGSATIEFESDASVLANDGSATEILSGTSPSSIDIAAASKAPSVPIKTSTKPATTPTPEKTTSSTPTTTPAVAATEPTQPSPELVAPMHSGLTLSAFAHSTLFLNLLELTLLLLLIFLAWHRYERGVPPFYFTFEGKAPMTPPEPEVLLKQFDTLKEAIKLEALSIQKIKEGQPLTEEEEKFLTLFKKLMNTVEGSSQ